MAKVKNTHAMGTPVRRTERGPLGGAGLYGFVLYIAMLDMQAYNVLSNLINIFSTQCILDDDYEEHAKDSLESFFGHAWPQSEGKFKITAQLLQK